MQEINQQNLRLLIPGKAAGVAGLISKNTGMPLKEALLLFYRSSLYKQLEREETKVWHYSPAQLYELGFRRLSRHKRNGPGHSKLAAHEKWILKAWNEQHMSARAIAEELHKQGIETSPSNVWKFVKVRNKNGDENSSFSH